MSPVDGIYSTHHAYHYAHANVTMSSSHEVLPSSVSSGSAFNAFDKLQGAKNYATWKNFVRGTHGNVCMSVVVCMVCLVNAVNRAHDLLELSRV